MGDNEVRREEGGESDPPQDSLVAVLRDLPRLQSIHEEKGSIKPFVPPPPFVNRVGGVTQGCSGLLLLLTGVAMLLTAMWYGYYLWGPGLVIAGGMLLTGCTLGVWRGYRNQVIASVATIVLLAGLAYFWLSYVPVAFRLLPIAGLGLLLGSLWYLVIMIVIGALVANVASLFYWKRLKIVRSRSFFVWVGSALFVCVVAVVLQITQQQQREKWMNDHEKAWAAAATTKTLSIGWTGNVTLGYSFVAQNPTDNTGLDVRMAELDAAIQGGTEMIRLTAGGDLLLESQTARLFKESDDEAGKKKAADRLAGQLAAEEQYMTRVTSSGAKLILSDGQYSPYLILWGGDNKNKKITWADFTKVQEDRIRHYAELYKPFAYEIVTEPDGYKTYSAIDEPTDVSRLDLWTRQTEALVKAVHDVSPKTLVGVTVAIDSAFDKDFYAKALTLDGVDFIGVRIFQPGAFQVLEDLMKEKGNPADHGKQLWIVETWYGYCLAPQRSMKLDGLWLDMTAAFAAKESIPAMVVNDYGCFLQAGGTALQTYNQENKRTSVWTAWRNLIQAWTPAPAK